MAGIAEVARQANLHPDFVKATFTAVAALAADSKVTIKGFGSFQYKEKAAREGRNPQTGEAVHIPAKQVLKFKASK